MTSPVPEGASRCEWYPLHSAHGEKTHQAADLQLKIIRGRKPPKKGKYNGKHRE